jgi:Tail-tube assembly protein
MAFFLAPLVPAGFLIIRGLAALAARRAGTGLAVATVAGAGLTAAGLTIASLTGGTKPDPFKDNFVGFPQDLEDSIGHYIEFVAQETKGQVDFGSRVNGATIRLPMPANLSVDYNPTYTSSDLGAGMTGAILKAGDRAMYDNTDILKSVAAGGAIAGAGISLLKGVGSAIRTAVSAAAGDAAAGGKEGDGISAPILKIAAGVAENPHKIVLFTGVNFRDHTFSWKLSPRNRRESDLIRTIINMFTYYSHPEYVAGGLFFKYPEFFRIRFRHPEYLFDLQPAVCTNVKVDFHGQGTPAYVRMADGSGPPAPAEITLSLTFKETEIITKDFLNKERITVAPSPYVPAFDSSDPLNSPFNDPMR